MTRPYAHRPDAEWAAESYTHKCQMIDRAGQTLERVQDRAPTYLVDSAVDAAWASTALGWYLEVPLDELRIHVVRGAGFVRRGLGLPGTHELQFRSIDRWSAFALLAGQIESAGEVARRLPVSSSAPQPADDYSALLAALCTGDDAAASRLSAALRTTLDDPGTPPAAARGLAHLDEIATAVAARDQDAFTSALRTRDAAVARDHSRSIERRRSWFALLDDRAVALARLGEIRGLEIPEDVASVPRELLVAVR
ncbi:hypothetical protein [Cellulomonas sp. URHB0016]